jgi:CHASE2 domain-containing sensor protein
VARITVAQTVLVRSVQHPGLQVTAKAKFWELFILGLIIGAFSFGLSWLWNGYEHKASDVMQYIYAEVGPDLAVKNPDSWLTWLFKHVFAVKPLNNRMVIIDIDEQICDEWAKDKYGGLCAALPRLPHSRLKEVFQRLAKSQPKLVVVDVDLRSEAPAKLGSDPFDLDVNSFTADEKEIRYLVESMRNKETKGHIPLLIAQPLIKEPQGQHEFDYVAVPTILHNLNGANVRFGHVQQDVRDIYTDDSVLRRFQATLQINTSSPSLNPNPPCPGLVEHLALRVCEPELGLACPNPNPPEPERKDYCGTGAVTTPLRFADKWISPDEFVQFRYSVGRHPEKLANWNVRSSKALDFDIPTLDQAIVIVGSTARGRGDYHFTPLDIGEGETPGVIVIANEVAAALEGKSLVETSLWFRGIEKFGFVVISTSIVYAVFWRPRLRRPVQQLSYGVLWKSFSILRSGTLFFTVIAGVVLINFGLGWIISFRLFGLGEVADPVTPVIAAVLDGLVDLCSIIGTRVAAWFD